MKGRERSKVKEHFPGGAELEKIFDALNRIQAMHGVKFSSLKKSDFANCFNAPSPANTLFTCN